jgi:hypothetical protein
MSSILAQNRSFEEHKGAASNGQLSPLEAEAIGLVVQLNRMVGHPCKIYNVLNVGAPVLYIGPRLSHVSEIASATNREVRCLSAGHGEVDLVVKHILRAREEAPQLSRHSSSRGPSFFSKESVLPKLIAELVSA